MRQKSPVKCRHHTPICPIRLVGTVVRRGQTKVPVVRFTHPTGRKRERESKNGEARVTCYAGEKLNQWPNYCMIAHSPKTWVSFGRKVSHNWFSAMSDTCNSLTNGCVRKNWASWVGGGQKIARWQKSLLASFTPLR